MIRHSNTVAVGVLSPIPGSAALLSNYLAEKKKKVFILGSDDPNYRPDHGVEIFDLAGQGRIDTFFLSGGQIDGQANINLTGIGSYPEQSTRWSGAFGSAYLYFLIPQIILFRERHNRQTLVNSVDFISAPGLSSKQTYRPGGPSHLITNLCVFAFDRTRKTFSLKTIHPGHSIEEVLDETGFEFEYSAQPKETQTPSLPVLKTLRNQVNLEISQIYPEFALKIWPN